MSTPHEASLTEKERAILAGLAAQAEADDPSLAATLRGRARRAGRAPGAIARMHVPAALAHWAWGVVLGIVGLGLMLGSLVAGLFVVGIPGVLLTFLGTYRAIVARPQPRRDGVRQDTPVTTDN